MKRALTIPAIATAVFFLIVHGSGAADKTIIFKNVSLVPMTGNSTIPDQAVVIRGSKIVRIGPTGQISRPEDAVVIDGEGAFLMPGLADMHAHYSGSFPHPFFNLFLANGVTTVRDLAQGAPASILSFRREIESGKRLGPRLLIATTVWGWEKPILDFVAAQRPLGFDALKINSYLSPADFEAVMGLAERIGWYTLGHIPYLVGLDGVIAGGMSEIAHVEELIIMELLGIDRSRASKAEDFDDLLVEAFRRESKPWLDASPRAIRDAYRPRAAAVAAKLKGKDITVNTTLLVEEDIKLKLNDPAALRSARHAPYIHPQFWQDIEAGKDKHQQFVIKGEERAWVWVYEVEKVMCEELKRAGVRLVLGTDVGPTYLSFAPGFSLLDELRVLIECGFSPYEAIAAGTRTASEVAARMTGRNEFGTIEAGKRADLILLEKNPLDSVENLRRPLGVMAAGRWLPRVELEKLLAVTKEEIGEGLLQAYPRGGVEGVEEQYRFYRDNNFYNVYRYSEGTLNAAAGRLLEEGHVEDALRLFRASTEYYPDAWSVFDNYGEACLKAGKRDLAIKSYERALVLDPSQAGVRKALEQLRGPKKPGPRVPL
jgi:imidazolonepropionase-like amidohydrolase